MSVTRYEVAMDYGSCGMEPDAEGHWVRYDDVRELIERAQDDARQVAEWQARYIGDPRQPGTWTRAQSAENAKRVYDECPNHTDEHGWQVRPLYTHPEASAPGLSDAEIVRLAKVAYPACPWGIGSRQKDFIAAVRHILTCASAATVAEPIKIEPARYESLELAASEASAHIESEWEKIGLPVTSKTVQQQQPEPGADELRASVEAMVTMLEECEWAEHVATTTGKGHPLAQRLETAITDLINEARGEEE